MAFCDVAVMEMVLGELRPVRGEGFWYLRIDRNSSASSALFAGLLQHPEAHFYPRSGRQLFETNVSYMQQEWEPA